MKTNFQLNKPSSPYIAATYISMAVGVLGFLIGLWNATMQLNEKGYYFTLLAFGLFGAVSVQKCVRDQAEGIRVSGTYVSICYIATILALLLLTVGLWNSTMLLSEKGYYAMSFVLALFGAVTVQKNVRDVQAHKRQNGYDNQDVGLPE